MYVDFMYYKNEFRGKVIVTEEAFDDSLMEATTLVNKITLNRCRDFAIDKIPEEIKRAVCATVEVYHKESNAKTQVGIESENNDGYSVKYSAARIDGSYTEKMAAKKAKFYLEDTGLLLRRHTNEYEQ